tara:strand:+ start:53 stop:415 length:363 start_codon:yes stop_codon:yes gene_type:complete
MNIREVIAAMILLVVIGIFSFGSYHFYAEYELYSAVEKLRKNNWKVFLDTSKCGYCVRQVRFLGDYLKKLNVVHCDNIDNKEECKGIKAFPTWEKEGKQFPGSRFSAQALSKLNDDFVRT